MLERFLNFEIGRSELTEHFGENLHGVTVAEPVIVKAEDLANAIQLHLDGGCSTEALVDWVNVVWFTDLFELQEDRIEDIVDVLEVLETLDEEGVTLSPEEERAMLLKLRGA